MFMNHKGTKNTTKAWEIRYSSLWMFCKSFAFPNLAVGFVRLDSKQFTSTANSCSLSFVSLCPLWFDLAL